MAVSDFVSPSSTQDKQRVLIVTVDPTLRRVEARLKDNAIVQIAVWETPTLFRWPIEGEWWTIHREAGYWMLDKPMTTEITGAPQLPVEGMDPGDVRIDSPTGKVVVMMSDGVKELIGLEDIPETTPNDVEDWQSFDLLNNWVNEDAEVNYGAAGYYKDPYGVVRCRGRISLTGFFDSLTCILPDGYWPDVQQKFICATDTDSCSVEVTSDGHLLITSGTPDVVFFDSISFRAA